MSYNIVTNEIDRDRFARVTETQLGGKVIFTPNFCTQIRNLGDLEILMRLNLQYSPVHLGTYIIRSFDLNSTIMPKLSSMKQLDIHGNYVEELFLRFQEKKIFFVDPALEYLYYEFHLRKLTKAPQMPKTIIGYLTSCEKKKKRLSTKEYHKWKQQSHIKFWHDLDKDPRQRNKLVGDLLDSQMTCGASILIPTIPLATSEGLLDIGIGINRISKAIAVNKRECATYFLLPRNALRNESMMDKIKSYVERDESHLTIFKFKNLDLENPQRIVEREVYGDLMRDLAHIKENAPERLFMVLENGYQTFSSACVGFDIVSNYFTGLDRDSGFGTDPYGHWYDPKRMIQRPYDDVKKIFTNNEHKLTCACGVCRNITDLETLNPDMWNRYRREHYALTMNDYMGLIVNAIKEKNIELAIDMISNSEMKNLKTLIPRF